MTQEEKQVLIKDLCARLPYGVKCRQHKLDSQVCTMRPEYLKNAEDVEEYEPYLRPMSSMTEEEEKEIRMLHHCFYREGNGWITAGVFGTNDCGCTVFEMADILNYLNANHFDYRGLIEKGLALEAPAGMYKID